ncbi:hypothetical protein FBU30_010030 [Linnemannia zychae]|nr:hypothetical protein FBU30_010030 [Linnemannia zychae]
MSPFLFVVLPKTSRGLFSALPPSQSTTASAPAAATAAASTVGSEEEVDYWLYFLCDFITPESKTPMLHVCSPPLPPATAPNPHVYMYNEYGSFYQQDYIHHHSYYYNHHPNLHYPTTTTATTITYPGGYRLKDMEKFVEIHAYPMLSLLYLAYLTNTDPEWTDRIKGGIRFLAERCREDLKEIYQSSADMNTPTLSLSPLSSTGIDPNRGHDEMDFDMDQDMEDEYEDEEEEDGQNGDEEEENKMMRLTEEDFWDPFVAAGKGSSVGGIDFQSLDLNRHHKSDPNDSTTQSSGSEGEGENLSEGGEDGLVLGADVLRQVNHPSIEGGILWLCETHHEMYCKGMAAEKLRLFIKRQGGLCNPMEKSVDIQFQRREDAREFYQMLKEYRCVIKLKIRLGWLGGATEEDLLELCTTVRSATIRDLTIDCGGAGEGNNKLSFRPMMNVICQMGFMALAVENFDGVFLSPDDILVTQSTAYRKNSWNVDSTGNHGARFRQQEIYSTLNLPVFPDNIQLKKLAFRYWAQVPDKTAIMNLIGILPNLSELEMMTDSVETLCASIQDKLQSLAQEAGDFQSYNSGSQGHHYHLSHLNLIEARPFGSKAEFTLSKPLGPNHTTRIQGSTWTTNQRPGRLLQTEIGLESLEFTQCLELWEQYTELQQIIARNHSTLRRVKMAEETEERMDGRVVGMSGFGTLPQQSPRTKGLWESMTIQKAIVALHFITSHRNNDTGPQYTLFFMTKQAISWNHQMSKRAIKPFLNSVNTIEHPISNLLNSKVRLLVDYGSVKSLWIFSSWINCVKMCRSFQKEHIKHGGCSVKMR